MSASLLIDPPLAAFVVIPLALFAILVWGVAAVWRRAGATAADARRAGMIAAWNVLGFALLINIVVVAILSTPTFAFFGADQLNTFVTDVPFVWLPAVMVSAAPRVI